MENPEIKSICNDDIVTHECVSLSEGSRHVLSVSKGLGVSRHDTVHAGLYIFSVSRVLNYAFHDALVCEFQGVQND